MTTRAQFVHHRPPSHPDAVADSHHCPVGTCSTLCSPGHVVCRLHWRAIPQDARNPLIAAFQRREQDPIGYSLAVDLTRRLALAHSVLDGASRW